MQQVNGKVCPNPRCGYINALDADFCAKDGTPLPTDQRYGDGQNQNDVLVALVPWMKITKQPQAMIAVYGGAACIAVSALPLLISEGMHYTLGAAGWLLALICFASAVIACVATGVAARIAAIIGFGVSVLIALLVSANDFTSHLLFIISLLVAVGSWAGVKGNTWKVNAGV